MHKSTTLRQNVRMVTSTATEYTGQLYFYSQFRRLMNGTTVALTITCGHLLLSTVPVFPFLRSGGG
ncbi:MAG: hypothetical protein Aurels2KO_30760 [Aureliella sp.]